MYEKVNPKHPDKVADRIAGAIVDLAYKKRENPKIACEVLIGHGECTIIIETNVDFNYLEIDDIVKRISENKTIKTKLNVVPQDKHLAQNQETEIRCGDNGIFKGSPINKEERKLTNLARDLYKDFNSDGKYIIWNDRLTICQSNANTEELKKRFGKYDKVNPLGDWIGGLDVDTGATNRKLGSDMGRAVTGGGLHGKDLSKADVAVNIYAHLKAQKTRKQVKLCCAIGNTRVDNKPYSEIVEIAREYINKIGGFEKLAEWGLI